MSHFKEIDPYFSGLPELTVINEVVRPQDTFATRRLRGEVVPTDFSSKDKVAINVEELSFGLWFDLSIVGSGGILLEKVWGGVRD